MPHATTTRRWVHLVSPRGAGGVWWCVVTALALCATAVLAEPKVRLRLNAQVGIAPLELAMLVNATELAPGYESLTLAIVDMPAGGDDGTVVYVSSQSLPPVSGVAVASTSRPAVVYMQRVFTLQKGHYVVLACLSGRDVSDICTDMAVEVQ